MPKTKSPILEFDNTRKAFINPTDMTKRVKGFPRHCVLCFFQDVFMDFKRRGLLKEISEIQSESGTMPIYSIKRPGGKAAFFHVPVGAPFATGCLEEIIAKGADRFIVCGGAGVLARDVAVGHLAIPVSAVRDEGTSYHYLPPGREVRPSPKALKTVLEELRERGLPHITGKTWTTDAFYRETPAKIARRKREGCITVEMEAAALFAVARFRKTEMAAILYSGDSLAGEEWDSRGWHTRKDVRRNLALLALDICLAL